MNTNIIRLSAPKRRKHSHIRVEIDESVCVRELALALAGCGLVLTHRNGLRIERMNRKGHENG